MATPNEKERVLWEKFVGKLHESGYGSVDQFDEETEWKEILRDWQFDRLETGIILNVIRREQKGYIPRSGSNDAVGRMEQVIKRQLTPSEASHLLSTFSSEAVLLSQGQLKDSEIHSLSLSQKEPRLCWWN